MGRPVALPFAKLRTGGAGEVAIDLIRYYRRGVEPGCKEALKMQPVRDPGDCQHQRPGARIFPSREIHPGWLPTNSAKTRWE
jgi:hypothetical protein